MSRRLRRIGLGALSALGLGYLLICGLMYQAQDDLIFHPTHEQAALDELRESPGNEPFDLERQGAHLRGALVLAPVSEPAPVLIYFGGNAEAVALKAEAFAWMKSAGAHLLFVPYRGYDGSSGKPNADEMRADALAVFDELLANPRVDTQRIYALGYSLGTGLASHLADKRGLAGLVLLAPYRRLGEIAEQSYPWLPVAALLNHDFDTLGVADEIDESLLVIHGAKDSLIPIEHGRDVVKAWKGHAELLALPDRDHNGMSTDERTHLALRKFMAL